jgi:predicted N-formylglutamate amidohydrolase
VSGRRGRSRAVGAGLAVVVTCEHGGNRVPIAYQDLFHRAGPALASHRGWDAGTVALSRDLAREVPRALPTVPEITPHIATVTRLLVDLNRSAHNPAVFSEWTRKLRGPERKLLLERYHTPHRMAIDAEVTEHLDRGLRVIHLAPHSFTPAFNGKMRRADLALLYDPARSSERELSGAWARRMHAALPELRVRRNQPYRGASDGLTTWLRRRHPDARYMGIEIEVNQSLLDGGSRFPREVMHALVDTLAEVVDRR